MVQDSQNNTMIGGQAQKEPTMGGIIILLTPETIIDPFPAWKPPSCHEYTVKGKKKGGFGCLELCLYGIFMQY